VCNMYACSVQRVFSATLFFLCIRATLIINIRCININKYRVESVRRFRNAIQDSKIIIHRDIIGQNNTKQIQSY
jgi:hypothetical protein